MRTFIALLSSCLVCIVAVPAYGQTTCRSIPLPSSVEAPLIFSHAISGTMGQYYYYDYEVVRGEYGGGTGADALIVRFVEPDVAIGTYVLGEGNDGSYSSCNNCVSVLEEITQSPGSAPQGAKRFFATEGVLNYTLTPGQPTESIKFYGLVLRELDNFGVLVPNGRCYRQIADEIFVDGFEVSNL